MDAKQKGKLEALKKQAQLKQEEQEYLDNDLFQECVAALGSYRIVKDNVEIDEVTGLASSDAVEFHTHKEEINLIDQEIYYIVWDSLSVPILESTGSCINNCLEDVLAVSFDTYFVLKSTGRAVGIRN